MIIGHPLQLIDENGIIINFLILDKCDWLTGIKIAGKSNYCFIDCVDI